MARRPDHFTAHPLTRSPHPVQPWVGANRGRGVMSVRSRFAAVIAAASMGLLLPAAAQAQQVTGLEVRQDDGFATLSWDPVPGATDYEIERTPAGAPLRTGVVVGVWRPNRQVNQGSPAFADAGFNPGDSLQWRVRARFGAVPQPYSEPVSGTTNPEFG